MTDKLSPLSRFELGFPDPEADDIPMGQRASLIYY